MEERLGEEWYNILKDEFDKEYMTALQNFISTRRSLNVVFPFREDVFNAYKLTPYSKVKVCIIGQDPYINPNEAHGLAFSTKGKSTPSLRKIAQSLKSETWNNDLTRWAVQGVFLLNKVLTVDAGITGSHFGKGWEEFTLKTIQELDKKGNVVFLLWGSHAKEYDRYIAKGWNSVITCEHPAYASYQNREWDNSNCFNETNRILKLIGEREIIW